jgi:hypothetical protein
MLSDVMLRVAILSGIMQSCIMLGDVIVSAE